MNFNQRKEKIIEIVANYLKFKIKFTISSTESLN